MNEWWVTVLCSVGSAVIGGMIGGFFTLLVANRNQRHQDEQRRKDKLELTNKEKPRLELKKYKEFKEARTAKLEECDLSALALGILEFKEVDGRACFTYDKKASDLEELIYVEYLFENTGQTEIEEVCISSNLPRFMSLMDMKQKDFYLNNHLLNYDVWSDKRYIKPKETLKVRIYYIKDMIPTTTLGSPELVVWLRDVNGLIWSQVLNAPGKEIEISRLSNSSELKEAIDVRTAIECFKNPMMW